MFLLWHPSLTAINLSYTFPILETSATALCGTTGIYAIRIIYTYPNSFPMVANTCKYRFLLWYQVPHWNKLFLLTYSFVLNGGNYGCLTPNTKNHIESSPSWKWNHTLRHGLAKKLQDEISPTRWGPLTTISGFIPSNTHLQPWLNRVCWGYNYN